MTDSFFNYSSGAGPQTPLDRASSSGVAPAQDAEQGFGTDSGLQTPLDRGTSSGTINSGTLMAVGTDSGLTTPVS